jgi:hypothetical protein
VYCFAFLHLTQIPALTSANSLPQSRIFLSLDSAFLSVLSASAVSRRSFQISNLQFEIPLPAFLFSPSRYRPLHAAHFEISLKRFPSPLHY